MDSPTPTDSPLDETYLSLSCYEPAGKTLTLTGEDLTRNVLLTGSIGSGKTISLNEITAQLIAHRADEPDHKLGLLIYDFKQDDTVAKVRAWARESGREADLRVLSADSPGRLALFGNLQRQADVSRVVEELMVAAPGEDSSNPYWELARRKRLTSALGILRLSTEGRIPDHEALQFLHDLYLVGGSHSADLPAIATFKQKMEQLPADFPNRHRIYLESLLSALDEWKALDFRTRSNEISTLSNALFPLIESAAEPYLHGDPKTAIDPADIIRKGTILVASLPALTQPRLTSAIARLLKARFYGAVQSRNLGYNDQGRLVGCIADEFPMIVTGGSGQFSDVTQLQSMRSMRCFLIAAAQGLEAISRQIGPTELSALLSNINSHFIFKTHEPAVAAFAQRFWGFIPKRVQIPDQHLNSMRNANRMHHWLMAPVCSPQALTELQPGEAFVTLHGRKPQPTPCYLVPRFFNGSANDSAQSPAAQPEDIDSCWHRAHNRHTPPKRPQFPTSDQLMTAMQDLDDLLGINYEAHGNAMQAAILSDMQAARPRQLADPAVLQRLHTPTPPLWMHRLFVCLRNEGVDTRKIQGLGSLPLSWVKGMIELIPRMSLRPWIELQGIAEIRWCAGLLSIQSIELPDADQLRRQEQATEWLIHRLYPNPFRPIKRRDALWTAHFLMSA